MEEKRKLKYMYQRMPKEKVNCSDIKKEVAKRLDCPQYKVNEIVSCFLDIVFEKIIAKKQVSLTNIGTLFATIKPGKNVVKMQAKKSQDDQNRARGVKGAKGELMWMPARWVAKFKPNNSIAKFLLKKEPSQEELDNIYKD